MFSISRLDKSANLVQGMADLCGTDLATLPNAERFRSVVLRCSTCGKQGECAKLQAESTSLDHAPDYCNNAAFFD